MNVRERGLYNREELLAESEAPRLIPRDRVGNLRPDRVIDPKAPTHCGASDLSRCWTSSQLIAGSGL